MNVIGDERRIVGLDRRVAEFRAWALPDFISPTTRAMFAEYMVRCALGRDEEPAPEWEFVDIRLPGVGDVEVKCSSFLRPPKGRPPVKPTFDIKKREWAWEVAANDWMQDRISRRRADVYVFALHCEQNWNNFDPLNLEQWSFLVLPTSKIDEEFGDQKTASLGRLAALADALPFEGLDQAIRSAIAASRGDMAEVPP